VSRTVRWLACFLEQKRKIKQPARNAGVKNIKLTHGKGWEISESKTNQGY